MGQSTPSPQVPQLDPSIQKLADQQSKDAQEFSANAASTKQALGNQAIDSSNQALAKTNKSITANANSRGLLYSGLRQGAMASAQGQSAADVSGKQADINQSVTGQAQSLNNQALQSQMGAQNLANQRNALAYNIAKNQ